MFDILPARDEFMKRWILLLSMETLLIPVKEKSQDLPYEVVVVEQGAGRVALLEPHSGAQRGAVSVGNSPHELAITSDGVLLMSLILDCRIGIARLACPETVCPLWI